MCGIRMGGVVHECVQESRREMRMRDGERGEKKMGVLGFS